MLKQFITTVFIAFILLSACTSSKQQFEKGNYEKAVALTQEKELLPPPPQDLFYSFTRPLFDQTASLLRRRYRYLRQ